MTVICMYFWEVLSCYSCSSTQAGFLLCVVTLEAFRLDSFFILALSMLNQFNFHISFQWDGGLPTGLSSRRPLHL